MIHMLIAYGTMDTRDDKSEQLKHNTANWAQAQSGEYILESEVKSLSK
jgi:hypothetical protein